MLDVEDKRALIVRPTDCGEGLHILNCCQCNEHSDSKNQLSHGTVSFSDHSPTTVGLLLLLERNSFAAHRGRISLEQGLLRSSYAVTSRADAGCIAGDRDSIPSSLRVIPVQSDRNSGCAEQTARSRERVTRPGLDRAAGRLCAELGARTASAML